MSGSSPWVSTTQTRSDGEPIEGPAVYFDGRIAHRRGVSLRLAAALEILEDGQLVESWRYGDIRRADGSAGVLRLSSKSAPELARLDVRNERLKAAIEVRCRDLGHVGAQGRALFAIVGWSVAAAVSIALLAIFGAPLAADQLAPLVPAALERRLGDAAANQVEVVFGDRVCTDAAGRAALDKLMDELAAEANLPTRVRAEALDSRVANAFALPGGRIFVLSALIDKADDVDELAGVLAHELGHVAHRDGLREMISSGGSAFLFGLLFGDVTGSGAVILAGRVLVASAYSRQAEASADAFAALTLHRRGRSARPLGAFLLRLTGRQNDGPIAMLASHPLSQDRLAALEKADAAVTGPALLEPVEWRALKKLCASR